MRHIIWRNRASAILGLLVMIMPYTGFPESLRTAFIVLLGFMIVVFGFSREASVGYSYSLPEEKSPTEPPIIALEEETKGNDQANLSVKKGRIRKKNTKIELTDLVDEADHIFDEINKE